MNQVFDTTFMGFGDNSISTIKFDVPDTTFIGLGDNSTSTIQCHVPENIVPNVPDIKKTINSIYLSIQFFH